MDKVEDINGKHRKEIAEMNICTYNILSGGANCLEQAMRCTKILNIDLGVLTETKLKKGKHSQNAKDVK
jgi:hypothetical protein